MIVNKLDFDYVQESAMQPNVEGLASISEIHEKRASYDVLADLLLILSAEPEINKTRLAQRSNIDTKMTTRYLKLLLDYRLVNKDHPVTGNGHDFQITRKGRGFLIQYQRLISMLK